MKNSMTRACVPVELGSDQTMNSEEGTGRRVTERSKSSTTEIDLEASQECSILSAESFRNKVRERERESASDAESFSRK